MLETAKERAHKLIEAGGLVRLAKLDKIEPALLLGALVEIKTSLNKLTADQKTRLKNKGMIILKQKKKSSDSKLNPL